MKPQLVLPLIFLPFSAMALETGTGDHSKTEIQIIDGKKFFSLNNARRQQGTGLSPSALAVINHPRGDLRITPANRMAMQPVQAPAADARPPAPLPWQQEYPKTAEGDKAAILSIFSPEEPGANMAMPNSASPSVK